MSPRRIRASLPAHDPAAAATAEVVVADHAADDPSTERLVPAGDGRAILISPEASESAHATRTTVLIGEPGRGDRLGAVRREVVVDGWRFEVDLDDADRAELIRRASKGTDAAATTGPTEVRSVIPGRVLSVNVAPGDAVTIDQPVMVLEAMKMQNEVRSPRDGVVARLAVGAGEPVDVGQLLLVIDERIG